MTLRNTFSEALDRFGARRFFAATIGRCLHAVQPDRTKKRIFQGREVTYDVLKTICRTHPQTVTQPLILISEIQRSGGTMLSQLFDGHTECHAHPPEMHIGFPGKDTWPSIDVGDDPENWFEMLFEWTFVRYARSGYKKPNNDSFRFLFLPDLQRELFLDYLAVQENVSQRTVLDAYMTSFFNAWLDYQNLFGPKKLVTGFAAGLSTCESNVSSYFEVYPEGRIISIIRDPFTWYVSARNHKIRENWFKDIGPAIERWSESALGMMRNKDRYGDRVCILRFEDLIQDTERVMRYLSDWLGISFQEILLTPTFNGQAIYANSSLNVKESGIMKEPLRRAEALTPEEREFITKEAMPGYYEVIERSVSFENATAVKSAQLDGSRDAGT